MEIIIVNSQKKIRLNHKRIKSVTKRILKILKLPPDCMLGINFVGKGRITRLNRKYFGKNQATDVIALGYNVKKPPLPSAAYKHHTGAYQSYMGEIIVCPGVALENSKNYNNAFLKELQLYIIHGVLHLLGCTDITKAGKARMRKKEMGVLERL